MDLQKLNLVDPWWNKLNLYNMKIYQILNIKKAHLKGKDEDQQEDGWR